MSIARTCSHIASEVILWSSTGIRVAQPRSVVVSGTTIARGSQRVHAKVSEREKSETLETA